MLLKFNWQLGSLAGVLLLTSACGLSSRKHSKPQEPRPPVVDRVATERSKNDDQLAKEKPSAVRNGRALALADDNAIATGTTLASEVVQAQVTLNKAAIEQRVFLYGFDLQYSSAPDPKYDLIQQAISLGHIPATFRRVGNLLQLVGDQSRLFESDINHPEILLAEYKIVGETPSTLAVAFARGGYVINEAMHGKGAPAPRETWIRSLEFVEDGDYLLQESALLLADGTVETYLESVFPRDSLVPADYQPLLNDNAREPLAARYRFLSNEKVYLPFTDDGVTTRQQTQVANRFHLEAATNRGHIDFYVTPNIPDKFLPAVKSGVEGWNRYFEPQLGRQVVRFLGRLPADKKIGDPRFNVINWDSVAQAGAAYESQASDPLTGIQSHSLIYLPLAWYNIGADLWHRRVAAGSTDAVDGRTAMARLAPKGAEGVFGSGRKVLRCARTLDDVAASAADLIAALEAEGTDTSVSTDEFGLRILASTLFHEVGHALGLNHNFKGSLAFDGTQPISEDNPTSWSIMDYNYYQHELGLFDSLGSISGHVLEYDRQIISQLYNQGADVSAQDAVLPACDDEDADSTAAGTDPLCNRYDSEKDPATGLTHALNNILQATNAAGYERRTLTEALNDASPAVIRRVSDTTVADAAGILSRASDLGDKLGELARFYLAAGAQSLRGNLINNDKAVRVWRVDHALADELAARQAYQTALVAALSWRALPDPPKAAAVQIADRLKAAVSANPVAGADDASRLATAEQAVMAFNKAFDAKIELSLTRLRQGVASKLVFSDANPFAVRLTPSGELFDFEAWAARSLSAQALHGLESLPSAQILALAEERVAAAKLLNGFVGHDDQIVDDTVSQLQAFIGRGRSEGNQNLVDHARAILKTLKP